MKKISTGQDSTLGTYKEIAKFFGPQAEKFIDDKIKEQGEDMEVLIDETQMMMLFTQLITREKI